LKQIRWPGFALGAILAVLPLSISCVSGSDLDEIHTKLADIQREVLKLQQQTSSKDEVADLGAQISTQTQSLLKSEADVQVSLKELSQQIEQLQANLGDTNYRLSQLSQQITATNQELMAVRSSLGRGLASAGPSGGGNASLTETPTDPQALYDTAYNDYLRGNYDLAILGFRRYSTNFPDTELTDNATYWTGESYFSQAKYQQAIAQFDTILNEYPRSDKTASAILKKGYAYLELGLVEQGEVQLRNVIQQFPNSDEANLARQRLAAAGR